jgi:hypothetical protein
MCSLKSIITKAGKLCNVFFCHRVRCSLGALLFFGRADYESALESAASETDPQSGGFYNACPNFETHSLSPRCSATGAALAWASGTPGLGPDARWFVWV